MFTMMFVDVNVPASLSGKYRVAVQALDVLRSNVLGLDVLERLQSSCALTLAQTTDWSFRDWVLFDQLLNLVVVQVFKIQGNWKEEIENSKVLNDAVLVQK